MKLYLCEALPKDYDSASSGAIAALRSIAVVGGSGIVTFQYSADLPKGVEFSLRLFDVPCRCISLGRGGLLIRTLALCSRSAADALAIGLTLSKIEVAADSRFFTQNAWLLPILRVKRLLRRTAFKFPAVESPLAIGRFAHLIPSGVSRFFHRRTLEHAVNCERVFVAADQAAIEAWRANFPHHLKGVDLVQWEPSVPDWFFKNHDRSDTERRYGMPENVRRVVAVGRLASVKNYELAIRAIAEVADGSKYEFVLIGEGELRERLIAEGRRVLGSRFRYLGQLPSKEISAVMWASDVGIITSRSEGLSNVMLEMACAGLPIVSTEVSGIQELKRLGASISVATSGSATELAELIERTDVAPLGERSHRRSSLLDLRPMQVRSRLQKVWIGFRGSAPLQ